jgi:hypothetical protein
MRKTNRMTIDLDKLSEMIASEVEPFEGWDVMSSGMLSESMGGLGGGGDLCKGFSMNPLVSSAIVEPGSNEQKLAQVVNNALVDFINSERKRRVKYNEGAKE